MKSSSYLKDMLTSINHKGYPKYKSLKGSYDFDYFILSLEHIQSDPFASPSRVKVSVKNDYAMFPYNLYDKKYKKISLEDYLIRLFSNNIKKYLPYLSGSGKSGLIKISSCGQEIIEKSALSITDEYIEVGFEIGFPARGRTILSDELKKIFFSVLPKIIDNTLLYKNLNKKEIENRINLSEDQFYLRKEIKEKNLIAFIRNGSILPRESGISQNPLKSAVKFVSPKSMEVKITLPHAGTIVGMGIQKGITLIAGGGYHGKSTLLKALELGIYNHIEGDGREYLVTDETAVKIRAEDGRYIDNDDISLFINNLPNKKDTTSFSTDNASGSTSQAANIIEAIESLTNLFLIDEDTSATNFMIRDDLMQKLISKDKEPITPFIERAKLIYKELCISSVIVVGSFGGYFDIADTVIKMDNYIPYDVTLDAKSLMSGDILKRIKDSNENINIKFTRVIKKGFIPISKKGVKIKATAQNILINRSSIDMSYVEQICDSKQLLCLGYILKYIDEKLADNKKTVQEIADEVLNLLQKDGFNFLFSGNFKLYNLAMVRKQDIISCISRFRDLKM
ncbi:ABC-ATPase domain-containing protein [Clostridium sp. BJN0001]|uniref:ABC-ATPase domain-containing protein n=1 Tax=Clostridium sp. BJN0001 TaxID=2930219 RepID=UPI001FD5535A|nr:ABC-ATPase domain-containing protein [Clostridium sp. BJN0001]